MRRVGRWVGPALRVLGLVAVIVAVYAGTLWALLAAMGGFVVAFGLTITSLVRLWQSQHPKARPSDFAHTVDLLRRAHAAAAGWAVGLKDGEVEVVGPGEVARDARRRGAAIVQLASIDGRTHVAREREGTYVAVGDFPYAAGLLLEQQDVAPEIAEAVAEDLRRMVASMRLAELEVPEAQGQLVAKRLALIAAGAQTLEGIARAGAELAQQLSQRGAAIVVQDASAPTVQILAVSTAADKRLAGVTLAAEAPAARAIATALPVVTHGTEDIFGPGVPERRRQDRAGMAYPLVDGHFPIGALVLLGPPIERESPLAEQIGRLVVELGPRLAAARAVHEAEQRAVLDPLTGLRNRRELERQVDLFRDTAEGPAETATLVYADLDRFKALNDTLGHAAGDAALRHVAGVLQAQIRDGDLVARIGGEEFAVWLPHTPLAEGLEVAERIRRAVEATLWRWNGTPYPLAASCGVASYPESVRDVNNLRSAADAALYRAKQGGRNRVEKAAATD